MTLVGPMPRGNPAGLAVAVGGWCLGKDKSKERGQKEETESCQYTGERGEDKRSIE